MHKSKTNEEVSLLIYCIFAVFIGIGLSLTLSYFLLKYYGGDVKVSLESIIAIAGLTIGLVIAIIGAFITVRLARMAHEIQERQSFFLSKEQILEFMKVAQIKFGCISKALDLMVIDVKNYHAVLEGLFKPIRDADGKAHSLGEYGYDDEFNLTAVANRSELKAMIDTYDFNKFKEIKNELIDIENQLYESYQSLVISIVSALDDVSFRQFLLWQNVNVGAFGVGEFSTLLKNSTVKYPHEQNYYQSYFEFLNDSSFASFYTTKSINKPPHKLAQSDSLYIESLVIKFYSYRENKPDYFDNNEQFLNRFLVTSDYILGRSFSITSGEWEYYTSPYIDLIISLLKLYPSKVELDTYFDESLIFASKTNENSILYTYSTNLYTSLPKFFHEFVKLNKLKDGKKDTSYKLPEIINGKRNLVE